MPFIYIGYGSCHIYCLYLIYLTALITGDDEDTEEDDTTTSDDG